MPCRTVRQGRLRPSGLTNHEAFSRPVPVASRGGRLTRPPTATIQAFSSGATDLCARDPIRDIQIMCLGSGVEPKTTGSRSGHLSVS